jgi:hypothetical protein
MAPLLVGCCWEAGPPLLLLLLLPPPPLSHPTLPVTEDAIASSDMLG